MGDPATISIAAAFKIFAAIAATAWSVGMAGYGIKTPGLSPRKPKDEGTLINSKTTDAIDLSFMD